MNSKYTKLLIKNFLISSADLCDLKLMSRLQNKVYPLYDRLSKDRGFESVVNHLSYVATHKEDYTIKILLNISKINYELFALCEPL